MIDGLTAVNRRLDVYLLGPDGMIKSWFMDASGRPLVEAIDPAPLDAFLAGAPLPILGPDPARMGAWRPFSVAHVRIMGEERSYLYVILQGERYDAVAGSVRREAFGGSGDAAARARARAPRRGTRRAAAGGRADAAARAPRRNRRRVRARARTGLECPSGATARWRASAVPSTGWRPASRARSRRCAGPTGRGAISSPTSATTSGARSRRCAATSRRSRWRATAPRRPSARATSRAPSARRTGSARSSRTSSTSRASTPPRSGRCWSRPPSATSSPTPRASAWRAPRRQGVVLSVRAMDGLPLVLADAGLVERAVANLLDNALRYTPAGGTVSVEVSRADGSEVSVSVRNTGEGIAPEVLPRVFDRFVRADESRGAGGAGLGARHRQADRGIARRDGPRRERARPRRHVHDLAARLRPAGPCRGAAGRGRRRRSRSRDVQRIAFSVTTNVSVALGGTSGGDPSAP